MNYGNILYFWHIIDYINIKLKDMKKIYCILAAAVAILFATEARAQIGIGVGYNLINNVNDVFGVQTTEVFNGFYVEASYDINILEKSWGKLGVQPALRLSHAGVRESDTSSGITTITSENVTYLDLPVFVKYSYEFNTLNLSAFAGPILSCGLSSVTEASAGDVTTKINNYEDDGYGRFDLKLGIGISTAFDDQYEVKVGYNFGMLNRYTGQIENVSFRTGVFYAGFAFNF